jgi:hypothetical protein
MCQCTERISGIGGAFQSIEIYLALCDVSSILTTCKYRFGIPPTSVSISHNYNSKKGFSTPIGSLIIVGTLVGSSSSERDTDSEGLN